MSEKVNVAKTWEDAVLDNFEEQIVETTSEGTETVASNDNAPAPVVDSAVEIVLPEGATIVEDETTQAVSSEAIVESTPVV